MKKSLVFRFIVPIAIFMFITTFITQFLVMEQHKGKINELANVKIEGSTKQVLSTLTTIDDFMSTQVKKSMGLLKAKSKSLGAPSLGWTINVAGKKTPDLLFGQSAQGNSFKIVDMVANTMGGTATLFVKSGDEFVRISTNVKKDDGTRAIGTILDPKGKAIQQINANKPFYGQVYILGKPYITGYEPIFNSARKVIGIYYVGYKVTAMKGLEESISNTKVLDNGFISVIDDHGKVRFHSQHITDSKIETLVTRKPEDWTFVEKSFPQWDFKVMAAYPKSDITKQVTDTAIVDIIIGIGVFILLMAFIYYIVNRVIVTSFKHIITITEEVARGNLTVYIDTEREDEIGKLFRAMHEMVQSLRDILSSVKAAAGNVANASLELQNNSAQMTQGMMAQSEKASHISNSSSRMSQKVVEITTNTNNIAGSSNEAAENARHGEDIVNNSISEVKQIAETVRESAQIMATLGDRSRQIGEIVSVINEIADQTNLLALNAAIEAARAGDMGRGFAVVADEVRKLAERTGKATSEITDMIKSIQGEVDKAVRSMEHGSEKVESGVEFSVQAGSALTTIISSINGLQSMIQDIVAATEDMANESEATISDIDEITSIAREANDSFQKIAGAATDMANLSNDLQQMVGRFKLLDESANLSNDLQQRGTALTY